MGRGGPPGRRVAPRDVGPSGKRRNARPAIGLFVNHPAPARLGDRHQIVGPPMQRAPNRQGDVGLGGGRPSQRQNIVGGQSLRSQNHAGACSDDVQQVADVFHGSYPTLRSAGRVRHEFATISGWVKRAERQRRNFPASRAARAPLQGERMGARRHACCTL